MKRSTRAAIALGAACVLWTATAHAFCIDTGIAGQNDVAVLSSSCTSVAPTNHAATCDMNGVHGSGAKLGTADLPRRPASAG